MFIELAEALDCPVCADGYGLVAFVRESDRRRIVTGHLGCPICEIEFPIDGGLIDFDPPDDPGTPDEVPAPAATQDPAAESGGDEAPAEGEALRLAALLGIGERPGAVVLLGPSVSAAAPRLAALAEGLEVLAVGTAASGSFDSLTADDLAAGTNPVAGLGARWPIRSGALAGAALAGPLGHAAAEAARCLAPTGRLVLLDAAPDDLEGLARAGFETLASDERTWVGVRHGG